MAISKLKRENNSWKVMRASIRSKPQLVAPHQAVLCSKPLGPPSLFASVES